MARSPYSDKLRNRTNRLKLTPRKKVYRVLLAPGIHLCYRRNAGPGTWSVARPVLKRNKQHELVPMETLQRIALADDHEEAGIGVMSYHQAAQHALKMVRGTGDADGGKPVTVAEALNAYAADLAARGGAKSNATGPCLHLPPPLLARPVMLLTEPELRDWLNGLVAGGLKPSAAFRYAKSLKAALTLAARRGKLTNAAAWKNGLKPPRGGNAPPRDNYWVADATINAIVAECYAEDPELGALVDVLATTGSRESQALRLMPRDLLIDDPERPRLLMPCSRKGKDRAPEARAVPITPRLGAMLRARAAARGPNRPLFDRLWNLSNRFRTVLERLDLDLTLTPYCLRHSAAIRQIRAGTPLRLIAFGLDTSIVELERTYARYLSSASDDLTRLGLLAEPVPAPEDRVVSLR